MISERRLSQLNVYYVSDSTTAMIIFYARGNLVTTSRGGRTTCIEK